MSYRMAEVIAQRTRDEDEAANEIRRLRAALSEIDDIADDEVDITNNGGPNLAMRVQGIARAALSSPQGTKS